MTDSTLRGSLGVAGVVFLVVAAAAPLTAIGGALPVMLAVGNGPGTPIAYLVVAVVLLVFSVGYAAMSRHVTEPGAFYAYVTAGLNVPVGLGAATLALLTYTAIQAGIYGLASVTLRDLVVEYGGPDLPWWAWAGGLLVLVALLGYRSIGLGARVLGVLLMLEIGIVAVLSIAILSRGGPQGWSYAPSSFFTGSPGIALMFAVASFVGFEATAIYSHEASNPRKTVSVATYFAVILIGVLYAIASWAIVIAFGADNIQVAASEDASGLVFDAAATYLAPFASDLMRVLLLTSLFAALLAFHNAIARYLHALGQRGSAPRVLGRTHSRHGSPHIGSVSQTVSAAVIVASFAVADADPVLTLFTWMSGLGTVSVLALMALTSLAIVVFFRRHPVDRRAWHTRVAPTLGLAGIIGITALVVSNFTTLINGSPVLATVLLAIVVATFLVGVGWSRVSSPAAWRAQ